MARWVAVALLLLLVAPSASAQDHTMEPKTASRLTIHFFADVVGQKTWGSIGAPSTFNLGVLDLFVHAQPAPEFYLLAEVGYEPTVQDYTLDVERMEAGWSPRIPDQARQLGGIRFDVIDALAVKLEGGNVRIQGSNGPYVRF